MKQNNDYSGLNADMFDEASGRGRKTASANNAPVDHGLAWSGTPETLPAYTSKTFGWMFLGLLTTFAIAFGFYFTGAWMVLYSIPALPFILMGAELIVVISLSARLEKLSVGAARGLFFLYALLNGLTFASLFVMYDVTALIFVFGLTALYFGALAAYGYFTKRDLSGLRTILVAGAVFLLLFWVLSIFLPMSGFEKMICFVGLAIFMGFTAYDTQKIKQYFAMYGGNPQLAAKASIFCALQLYLDFINLFLYMLRLLGRRSNN